MAANMVLIRDWSVETAERVPPNKKQTHIHKDVLLMKLRHCVYVVSIISVVVCLVVLLSFLS